MKIFWHARNRNEQRLTIIICQQTIVISILNVSNFKYNNIYKKYILSLLSITRTFVYINSLHFKTTEKKTKLLGALARGDICDMSSRTASAHGHSMVYKHVYIQKKKKKKKTAKFTYIYEEGLILIKIK